MFNRLTYNSQMGTINIINIKAYPLSILFFDLLLRRKNIITVIIIINTTNMESLNISSSFKKYSKQ